MAAEPLKQPPKDIQPSRQYDLFTSFFGDPKDLSNTIELWDAIPKYSVSARQQTALRDENGRLPQHVAEFEYASANLDRPVRCRIKIRPALIEVEEGVFKDFYPSQSEEIIEEVLKKIFTDQQYGMHSFRDAESWVRFTLHMIRKELRERGHTRSLDEIKRSLEIMASTSIDVEMEGRGRGAIYTNPILSNMVRTTRADIEDDPGAKWTAQLPALISKSVNELSYRQFNYALHMRLSTPLARWLHKRLVHRYRNASLIDAYHFMLTSVQRDSGLLNNKRMSANAKALSEALDELKAEGILFTVDAEKRFEGRKLADVKYSVYATREFTSEVKAASARLKDGKAVLGVTR
ncbi:MAG: hypothetical protein AAGA97_01740 [Pseudomonadota bacterium]